MGRIVDRKAKAVEDGDSEIFREDGKAKCRIWNGIEKCACLRQSEGEKSSRGPFVTQVLNVFQESGLKIGVNEVGEMFLRKVARVGI